MDKNNQELLKEKNLKQKNLLAYFRYHQEIFMTQRQNLIKKSYLNEKEKIRLKKIEFQIEKLNNWKQIKEEKIENWYQQTSQKQNQYERNLKILFQNIKRLNNL